MAAVVVTGTVNRKAVWGDRRVHTTTLTFDTGDYTTGGIAVTAADFGLQVLEEVIPLGMMSAATAATTFNGVRWDAANSKLQLTESAADGDVFDEKPAEAMTAGASLRCLAIGY